jgi:DNA-binding SARP family transcriptional activator
MHLQYSLLDRGTLVPAGEVAAEASHRPLRIYTLGRFTLVSDATPLCYSRKAPSKPLLLLKALIAAGGRQVAGSSLAAMLWPDIDGDRAQQAFDTTLHRLRKYLGDDRYLIMEDGRVTLNSELVWVDVWSFERSVSALQRQLRHGAATQSMEHVVGHMENMLRTYQGHFLSRDETTCWSVSLQERLRSKYIHCIIELGSFWEQHGLWSKAIFCYQKGIEVDDLIETFYQRLMVCYRETGRRSEAIAAYRQCRRILSVVLALEPTAETRSIYQTLLEQQHYNAG